MEKIYYITKNIKLISEKEKKHVETGQNSKKSHDRGGGVNGGCLVWGGEEHKLQCHGILGALWHRRWVRKFTYYHKNDGNPFGDLF